jgi:exonuclease SbcD
MKKIRFIHTADIHLGSLLHVTGDLPSNMDEVVKNATFIAFERICSFAAEKHADFIVISGDLYDREARSVKASEFFSRQCAMLAEEGIPVYVIAGNHDPLSEQSEIIALPENVHILGSGSPQLCTVTDNTGEKIAYITGQSYSKKSEAVKMHEAYKFPDKSLWNIALLHTQLSPRNLNYVPCSAAELAQNPDVHYWALGHIHACSEIRSSFPVIWYPGIPQGRDFGEEGAGGFLFVELDPHLEPHVEFVPVSPVIWQQVDISIDEDSENPARNISEIEDRLYNAGLEIISRNISEPVEGIIVRWVLHGKSPLYETFYQQEEDICGLIAETMRNRLSSGKPFVWTEAVALEIEKPIDFLSLKKEMTVIEEIERIISMSEPGGKYADGLLDCLGQVWERPEDMENINENRLQLDDSTVSEILRQARRLITESFSRLRY